MSDRIIQLKDGQDLVFPRITKDCILPNKGSYGYAGDTISLHKNEYKARKIAGLYGSQGLAIYGNYAFRVNTGNSSGTILATCSVYDISDLDDITRVSQFNLQSGGRANHANSAQFAPFAENGNDFPYLYVSGNYTSYCCVYKVTTTGAELAQTITVNVSDADLKGMNPNVQVGDDGYLYAVSDDGGDNDYVIQFNRPNPLSGDTTINDSSALRSFSVKRDKSLSQTWQGMKIYGGKVYLLRGTSRGNGIEVIDIGQERVTSVIPIDVMPAEPEDVEILNDRLVVAYGNQTNFLLLSF